MAGGGRGNRTRFNNQSPHVRRVSVLRIIVVKRAAYNYHIPIPGAGKPHDINPAPPETTGNSSVLPAILTAQMQAVCFGCHT